MVRTLSTMQLALGARAPAFSLPDTSGRTVTLDSFKSAPALLVAFICNHCPFVVHIKPGFLKFAADLQPRGLAIVGINANDISTHPDDAPEKMAAEGYPFPYLFDATQSTARAYAAACTPDFFLFDRNRALVYRGQMDGSRPGNGVPVTGADLRAAVEAVLAGKPAAADQKPSMGCNIKWKPGNEPAYFKA